MTELERLSGTPSTMTTPSSLALTVYNALYSDAKELGRKLEATEVVATIERELTLHWPQQADKPPAKPRVGITGTGLADEEWLQMLEAQDAYKGIDVRRELGKCQVWASTNNQKVSRKRFVNWLNKAEPTIGYNGQGKSSFNRPPAPVADNNPEPTGWKDAALSHETLSWAAEREWSTIQPFYQQQLIKLIKVGRKSS